LAGDNVFVFEYKKTQKRKNEEQDRMDRNTSRNIFRNGRNTSKNYPPRSNYSNCSTRDVSPDYRHRSSNDRDYVNQEHLNAPASLIVQNPVSAPDSAVVTQHASDDECPMQMNEMNRQSSPMNMNQMNMNSSDNDQITKSTATISVVSDESISIAVPATSNNTEVQFETQTPNSNMQIHIQNANTDFLLQSALNANLNANVQAPQPSNESTFECTPSATSSFDEVTKDFQKNDKFAQILLQQCWDPSFNQWSDMDQIRLMIIFMMEFKNNGPEAAINIIKNILDVAGIIETIQSNQQQLSNALGTNAIADFSLLN